MSGYHMKRYEVLRLSDLILLTGIPIVESYHGVLGWVDKALGTYFAL